MPRLHAQELCITEVTFLPATFNGIEQNESLSLAWLPEKNIGAGYSSQKIHEGRKKIPASLFAQHTEFRLKALSWR
jgi:hypothetical protein